MLQEILSNPELLFKIITGTVISLYILLFIIMDPKKKVKN